MGLMDALAYGLVLSLGIEGPITSKLFKTGEISNAVKKHALLVLIFTLLHGFVLLAVIFYIAWNYFSWQHFALLLISNLVIGFPISAHVKSKADAWIISTFFTIAAAICTIWILIIALS